MAQQNSLRKLEDQLHCPVCLENFRGKDPRGLPCLHNFCKECLEKLPLDKGKITCPLCRRECSLSLSGGIEDIPVAFAVNMLLELYNSLEEQAVASGSISGASDGTTVAVCTLHGKPREYYCKDCDMTICCDCLVDNHQGSGHFFQKAEKFYDVKKREIEQTLETVCQWIVGVEDAANVFDDEMQHVNEESSNVKAEIDRFAAELHRRLDLTKEQLVGNVETLQRKTIEKIRNQKKSVDTILFQLKSCQDFTQSQLTNGSKVQVVALSRKMINYMRATTLHMDKSILSPNQESIYFDATEGVFSRIGKVLHISRNEFIITNIKFASTCNKVTTFKIIVPNKTELPHHGFVTCHALITPNSTVICKLKKIDEEAQQYRVSLQPDTLGPHEVKIEIGSKPIRGSPFQFRVFPATPIGQTPIRTIRGLQAPVSVATKDNHILVGELVTNADCISVIDSEGEKVISFGRIGDNNFASIADIAIAEDGGYLILDSKLMSVFMFSSRGQIEKVIRLEQIIRHPVSIAVYNGRVFVGDLGNAMVHILNADLTYETSFGQRGKEDGEFRFIKDVAIDSKGNVFVSDFKNNTVQKFSTNIQGIYSVRSVLEIMKPTYLCIDSQDILYIMQQEGSGSKHNHYLQVYDCSMSSNNDDFVRQKLVEVSLDCTGHGKSYCQNRMAVDERGFLYICHPSNGTVTVH